MSASPTPGTDFPRDRRRSKGRAVGKAAGKEPSGAEDSAAAAKNSPASGLLAHLVETAVEVVGRADERQVGERLREVPQVLAAGTQLLAVEADVVGVAQHLLEEEPGLLEIARPGDALDEPERAHRERPLPAL